MKKVVALPILVTTLFSITGCIPKPDAVSQNHAAPHSVDVLLEMTKGCDVKRLNDSIGKAYTPTLGEQMKKNAKALSLRVAHENGVITMDYNPDRLNIFHNDDKVIVKISCG